MAMDKVQGSPAMRPGLVDQFQRAQRGEDVPDSGVPAPEAGAAAKTAAADRTPADKAEISEAAHRMADLREAVDTGRAALNALPDVREEKVAEVRDRLDKGYYQSVEVIRAISGKLGPVLAGLDEL